MTISRKSLLYILLVTLAAAAILLAMDRPLICTCGTIKLWVSSAASPETSQMLADWYSPSHILHGFLFYAALWLVARRWSVERRFLVALSLETLWEVFENSPVIIDRYRAATVAVGYTGDSVLNSLSDIAMMAFGFFLARRLPLRVALVLIGLLELIPLLVIRDNLTLNVWMLVHPSDAIRAWQAGA